MKREVLIIGGTGFIGAKINQVFESFGDKVTLLHRTATPTQISSENCTHIIGDRNDIPAQLHKKFFNVVIDTCGYAPQDFSLVNSINFDHYIFISSVSVYSKDILPNQDELAKTIDPNHYPVIEKLNKFEKYSVLKFLSEIKLRELSDKVTVVRPSFVLGEKENTGRLKKLLALQKVNAAIPLLPDRKFQFIDVDDLAFLIKKVADCDERTNYNLVGPSLNWSDFVDKLIGTFEIKKYHLTPGASDFPFWDSEPNSGIRSLTSRFDWISNFNFTSLEDSLLKFKTLNN